MKCIPVMGIIPSIVFFRKQDTHLGRGNGIPNLDLRLQCPAQYGYSFVYTTLLPE